MPLSSPARKQLETSLHTLSMPPNITASADAVRQEVELLAGVLERAGVKSEDQVRRIFEHLKAVEGVKWWPSAFELKGATAAIKSKSVDPSSRYENLSIDERDILENQIIPTALRWLDIPSLKDHALSTLEYWGRLPENLKVAS